MRTHLLFALALVASLNAPLTLGAQNPADSIMLQGIVINSVIGEPAPFCNVRLLRADTVVAASRSNLDGLYDLGIVPADTYTIQVSVSGSLLMMTDLTLDQDADLSLYVTPDTAKTINLLALDVTAKRIPHANHQLGSMLIRSPHDIRLWTCRPWKIRNAQASVRDPDDHHSYIKSIRLMRIYAGL